MKRAVVLWSILAGFLGLLAIPVLAAGPEGMRLYVFTSGSIGGFPKSALQIGAQGTVEWAPIGFFVIKHPKALVPFAEDQHVF
jgi:N-acyl homoserine lactone hydrolase